MICPKCGYQTRREVPEFPFFCACGATFEHPTPACIHLGEQTGESVKCSTCSGGDQPIRRCEIHGTTLLRKPVIRAGSKPWDGMNCVECRAEGLGHEVSHE